MSWWGFWGPPARAGATVRPVASPTAFVFCYVLWVAGRISALLRRGDLGPEWRGQLSGVTQLRGSSHNCEVAKRTLTAAFGTTTTWRGRWAGGVGGGRSPTANGGSHRLEMDREWSLLFQKMSPACERPWPPVRLLLGPTRGAGCGCPTGSASSRDSTCPRRPFPGRGAQGGPDAWRSRGLGAEPSAPPCGQSGNCGVRPRAPRPARTLPSARPPHSTGLICTQRHPGPGIRLPPRGARSTTRANSESRDRMGSGVTDAKEGQGQERTVLGR